jgi:hypothetical protein
MHRLFLDANVLFSAAYHPNAGLVRLWKLSHVVLCTSCYALEAARINLEEDEQKARLLGLSAKLQLFPAAEWQLPRGIALPVKDVPIVLAAVEAHSTHLLTGDVRHFGPYFGNKIEGLLVTLPGEYLRMRDREK